MEIIVCQEQEINLLDHDIPRGWNHKLIGTAGKGLTRILVNRVQLGILRFESVLSLLGLFIIC